MSRPTFVPGSDQAFRLLFPCDREDFETPSEHGQVKSSRQQSLSGVAVEKLASGKFAKNAMRQDALHTIFWDRVETFSDP